MHGLTQLRIELILISPTRNRYKMRHLIQVYSTRSSITRHRSLHSILQSPLAFPLLLPTSFTTITAITTRHHAWAQDRVCVRSPSGTVMEAGQVLRQGPAQGVATHLCQVREVGRWWRCRNRPRCHPRLRYPSHQLLVELRFITDYFVTSQKLLVVIRSTPFESSMLQLRQSMEINCHLFTYLHGTTSHLYTLASSHSHGYWSCIEHDLWNT